jgi:spore coat polysaccharide biosynthesis protein SpsF
MLGDCGMAMVKEHGHTVFNESETVDYDRYEEWLAAAVQSVKPQVIILDIRDGLSRSVLQAWRRSGIVVVTIDDPSERRLDTDMAFYPPIPQVGKMDWAGFTGKLYAGWEWVILRPEFALAPVAGPRSNKPQVLITMGGSDPAGLTLKVLEVIDDIEGQFDTNVVIGSGFVWTLELEAFLKRALKEYKVLRNVSNMAEVMANSDLAIASFGVTAYELAAMGVPALYLCLTDDHAESATAFVQAGLAISFGTYTAVDFTGSFKQKLETIILDQKTLNEMANKGSRLVDGLGVKRIAKIIFDGWGANEGVARP